MSCFLERLQSESDDLLNPDQRNDPALQRWMKGEIYNPKLNLANTNQTKPTPSHWRDQDPQPPWHQPCQCCDTNEEAEEMRQKQKHFHIIKLCGKMFLCFSISARWNVTLAYWSHCGRGILKLIRYVEVFFLACPLLHSSPWMIRSRLNTMDELPNSPVSTRMERRSNVPLRPRHGLLIVFAEGVTVKNKNRLSFSAADPLIRAAVFGTH